MCCSSKGGENYSKSLPTPIIKTEKYYMARLTFYTNCSKYGRKTASGKIAKEGVTIAAHKQIKFGKQYYIPNLKNIIGGNGLVEVQDRGSAINKRTASHGKYPVIDVYVSSTKKVNKLKRLKNNIVKVYYR